MNSPTKPLLEGKLSPPKATKPRRTQAERRASAERNLLTAAARLIAIRGLANVSLADIGKEAGYSHGLVNHHFGSKTSLIERLVEFVGLEFTASFESALLCDSAPDKILGLVQTFFGMLQNLSPIHRSFLVLWSGAVVGPSETQAAMAQSDRSFRAAIALVVEEGIRDGVMRSDVSPRGFATALVGQLRGVALQMFIDFDDVDLDETLSEIERSLKLALSP